MKGQILFLAHRLPFPPDRGDKIRSHHILAKLAELAPVHVATFAETEGDLAHEADLASVSLSHCLVRRSKRLAVAGIEALLGAEPVSLAAFQDGRISAYVERVLAERPVDTIFVFSGQMGQYVPRDWKGRLIVDLVDVDSAKFEAYSQDHRWPMRWIEAREGRLLAREETRLAEQADSVLLVSQPEVEFLQSRLPQGVRATVTAMRNGVDFEKFDPARFRPHKDMVRSTGPHLVFTGQMDYQPNVAAALRVIDRVLPEVRRNYPKATFHIVGRSPAKELLDRAGKNGCRVWGEVPDVRPFLAGADLAIAPLVIARGIQNKVLEAMSMALPVVLTPEAATGIGATNGVHLAVETSDESLVARCLAQLADRDGAAEMGLAARGFILENFGWPVALSPLADLVGRAGPKGQRRDAA